MQAGFPAAPQAPVATQPRQMVQPLPTGAERTPVVVPQFNAALSNVMMNRGSTDQATVPAAQSAASEADVPDAIPRVTAPATSKAVPMAGLQAPSLDPPSGAEPAARSIAIATSKTEFVDRPGPLRQSSAKQIGPSEIPAGQGLISTQPFARNPATVPQAEKSLHAGQAAAPAAEMATMRRPIAGTAPSRIGRSLPLAPKDPAPATMAGNSAGSATKSILSRPTAPRPSNPDEFTADAPNTLDAAFLSPAMMGISAPRAPGQAAAIITPTAVTGMPIAEFAATNRSPGATATVIAARATVSSEPQSTGAVPAPADRLSVDTPNQAALPDSAPAEQATSPTQHRPATVQPPLASNLAAPPTAASQDPGQPVTEPLTPIAVAPSSSAVAFATGAPIGEGFAQSKPPQIVRSEAAGGSPPVQQTVQSPPLAKAPAATQVASVPAATSTVDVRTPPMANAVAEPRAAPVQTARSTTRTPANHGPLAAVTPTQAGSAAEIMTTAAPAGRDTADGAPVSPSVHPSSPTAIDAVPTSAPSSAPQPAAVSAPEDTLPASRPASPAAQMAPVLVSLGHMSDGTQRLTMRLDPPELGRVQVRIDRPIDAPARVEITVEKVETLTLLLRDQQQLQHALDQAGVPAEGRSVTFHVASPEPASRAEPPPGPMPGVATGGPNGEGSHGAPRHGGQAGRHPSGTTDANDTGFTPVAPLGWARGGLDITA